MFRAAIRKMAPYLPGEQPARGQRVIKLNTNENPYPPSPRVRAAIMKEAGRLLRLYPPPRADAFLAQASRLYGVPADMMLAGNGSDELLSMLFRAVLDAGDRVAYPTPTYSLYDTLAQIEGARIVGVPFPADFKLPCDALARAKARLTIVCNPNSPSGTFTPVPVIEALARRLSPRLLVVDEAYVDFAAGNALGLVGRHRNVVVLRSLSKSFSLAGVRLGLAFAQGPIIGQLCKVKDSYNLSRLSIAAGSAALAHWRWAARNVARTCRIRDLTARRLRALGFEVPASSANFLLARLPGRPLASVAAGLRRRGILVRYFPQMRDAIRVSIGRPAEMRAFLAALGPLAARLLAGSGRSRPRRRVAPRPATDESRRVRRRLMPDGCLRRSGHGKSRAGGAPGESK